MMYFNCWKSPNDNLWYWHLKGGNHEIVASSEGYTTKAMALKGIKVTKRCFFARVNVQS